MAASKNVVFITGANTGLGWEVIKALLQSSTPYHIIMGSRSLNNAESAIKTLLKEVPNSASDVTPVQADLTSDASLEAAVKFIEGKFGKIDTLINNAGASFDTQIQSGKMGIREAWNASWDVNVSGTHVLTTNAVPLLLKSSDPRLMFVTSGTASCAETAPPFAHPNLARINEALPKGWPKPPHMNPTESYRSAKTGLNMLMRQWVKILTNDGVKVWAISPGFLATGLGNIGKEQLLKVCVSYSAIHTDDARWELWIRPLEETSSRMLFKGRETET
jgi:NAD(P)-dependent dehydrogenase (short-subunit alcohol dehydrogenase family)